MHVQGASENYQLIKVSNGSLQGLNAIVEPKSEFSDSGTVAEMAEAISREIYAMLRVRMDVSVAAPGSSCEVQAK